MSTRRRVGNRLRAWWKRFGYWTAVTLRRRSADPIYTDHNWLVAPKSLVDEKVCLLVTWCPGSQLSEHAQLLGRSWSANGFRVVVIVVSNKVGDFDTHQDLSSFEGVMVRENNGYDFGAWATAIRSIPEVKHARSLVLTNDSVFGPLSNFSNFLERMAAHPADLVGAIGSRQSRPHIQSFLLMFKPAALKHPAFDRFWNKVRNGDREWAIRNYELPLQQHFLAAGLSAEAIFSAPAYLPENTNPSLTIWRELVEEGFPFVKVQLLRDNPARADLTNWQGFLSGHGYDPAVIERHLGVRAH